MATVFIETSNQGSVTDVDGNILIKEVKIGSHEIVLSYIGYETIDTVITISISSNDFHFHLKPKGEVMEEVTVKATREFISGEELEEKAIMNAANISLVLRESTGIQIQQTSLSSGNSSIRIFRRS